MMMIRRFYSSNTKFYNNASIDNYSKINTKKVTLKQLIAFSRNISEPKLLKSANYVKEELTVRIAHRIRDFQHLPFIVGLNGNMEKAYSLYTRAFDLLKRFKRISNLKDNEEFCALLKQLLHEHRVVIPLLSKGMKQEHKHLQPIQLDMFMNNMLRTRIGRRVLAEQHILLSEGLSVISQCSTDDVVAKCIELSRAELQQHHAKVPKVVVTSEKNIKFHYVMDHIEYILFELLKNALHHAIRTDKDVEVLVTSNERSVFFRVSDYGLGFSKNILPPNNSELLWSFYHHFQNSNVVNDDAGLIEGKVTDKSKSLHIGLQLARVFANYWGGEIRVCTMYGYGSDVYVRLDIKGETEEKLVVENYGKE